MEVGRDDENERPTTEMVPEKQIPFIDLLRNYEVKHGIVQFTEKKFSYPVQSIVDHSCFKSFYQRFHFTQSGEKETFAAPIKPYSLPLLSKTNAAHDVKYFPLTFLPDFIIEEIISDTDAFFSMPLSFHSNAVVLIADVSGFTHLTELYSHKEVDGADALAADLNRFMSNLASALMLFGGDILRFAGDAYLCQWEGKRDTDLIALTEQAYKCAVFIQSMPSIDSCRMLKVKIGISLGETTTFIMGSPSEYLLFAVTGPALLIARKAEQHCIAGEIVLSDEVYHCVRSRGCNLYETTFVNDGYVKISGFPMEVGAAVDIHYSGRLRLFHKVNSQRVSLSRAFLIPILRDIKTKDQLKYLSEVSNVTTMFILLSQVDVDLNPENLDPAYQKILVCVKKFEGVLNKVVLFDKGCSFLVVFGLPSMKHLNDAARAVLCAECIIESMINMNMGATIGLSSGTCFCGIVGHIQRQEYTVIGWRVNMACRLMTTYPDEPIVIDADTFHLCKRELGEHCFFQLEKRKLKGIDNVPKIYGYRRMPGVSRKEKETASVCFAEKYHRILCDGKIEGVSTVLKKLRMKSEIDAVKRDGKLPVIVIGGPPGCGKTFLMHYAVSFARMLKYHFQDQLV